MGKEGLLQECEYLARAIRIIIQGWGIEVILALHADGPLRFSELKKNCVSQFRGTISSRTLADRLKLFQLRGFIERTPYNEVPPRVEYRLTEDGKKLAQALCAVLRTAVEKIDRSHPGSMADLSYSKKNPLVDEEWLRNLDASRKFMIKKLEKDPDLAKHIANVVMSVRG